MLLAIDAGNTNLVFALVDGGEIKARWRIATDPRRTADQYAVWLHQLLELEGFSRGDVDEPHNVGADRALNAIAAHAKHPGDLIIIDFGTATTFDVVDAAGAYKGGIIAPGINLSLDALVNAAARLPRIAITAPDTDMSVIGRTTESQMIIGIYWGYVAMIEGLTQRQKREIGREVTVVATGGLATLFDKHTDVFDAIEPDLTIQGLSLLYDRTASR